MERGGVEGAGESTRPVGPTGETVGGLTCRRRQGHVPQTHTPSHRWWKTETSRGGAREGEGQSRDGDRERHAAGVAGGPGGGAVLQAGAGGVPGMAG